jgi:hypothetical protein
MQASLQLAGVETRPSASIRILGVWIDPRLSWGPHVKEVLRKMETQTNALLRTTASTWGATFTKARQIYNAVIRPALTYGSTIWHTPTPKEEERTRRKRQPVGPVAKLKKVQNKCLRVVAGAYRATPVSVLETETFTPPLNLHLDAKLARFRLRHKQSGMEELVTASCTQIRRKLMRGRPRRRRRTRRDESTEGEKRTRWAEAWLQQGERQALLSQWKQRWEANRPEWGLAGVGPPSRKTIQLHAELQKAESSVLTQIRTGRIGLAAFLNKARVPEFPSPMCQCGQASETAKHVIAHCPRFTEVRRDLRDPRTGLMDIKSLVSEVEGAKRLARWFLRLRILPQFFLAEELLYGRE